MVLFFKQKTAYEMRISDWSSDVCSSDLERGELVLENHLAVVEQPPDQGRLAVVDAAAGDEAQQRLLLMAGQIGVDILGNQRIGDIDGEIGRASCRKRVCQYV